MRILVTGGAGFLGSHLCETLLAGGSDVLRYRCKACGKSFNALIGTPLARLRHKERWLDFAPSLKEGDTVQESAGRCDIAVGTAFRWRHRFLWRSRRRPHRCAALSKPPKLTFLTVARVIDSSIVSPASVAEGGQARPLARTGADPDGGRP